MQSRAQRNPGGGVWQPLRWPVNLRATLREQGVCDLPVKIVDISLTGCCVSTGFRTKVGAPARLAIADFTPFRATIVWSDQSRAALQFEHPLHLAVVRHIISLGPVSDEQNPARVSA